MFEFGKKLNRKILLEGPKTTLEHLWADRYPCESWRHLYNVG